VALVLAAQPVARITMRYSVWSQGSYIKRPQPTNARPQDLDGRSSRGSRDARALRFALQHFGIGSTMQPYRNPGCLAASN